MADAALGVGEQRHRRRSERGEAHADPGCRGSVAFREIADAFGCDVQSEDVLIFGGIAVALV